MAKNYFEFETILSADKCLERLNKLRKRSAYRQAKEQVKIAVPIEVIIEQDGNGINFAIGFPVRSRIQEVLWGNLKIGDKTHIFAETEVTTLWGELRSSLFISVPIVIIAFLLWQQLQGFITASLFALACFLGINFASWAAYQRRTRLSQLIENILTEPDESKL